MRIYRVRPEDMRSVSGVIEDIESGEKESFHSINELQSMLEHSIGKGQLGFTDFVPQELNTHRRYSREALKERIIRLRLGKMLAKKRIDLQHYLYNQPAADIMKHIQ